MTKKKKSGRKGQKRARDRSKTKQQIPLPDRRAMEGIMQQFLPGAPGAASPVEAAQQIMYQAFDADSPGRQIALAHDAGLFVMHHDDGAIRPIIPDLIEIGVDMLDPIQWRCKGMEREALARDFGDKLVFHGGIDNQATLAFGTPEDVRREVAENIRIFADARGHIIGPCHNIQPVSPTENILALYEAAREYGDPAPRRTPKEGNES